MITLPPPVEQIGPTDYDKPLDLRGRDSDEYLKWMDIPCVVGGTWNAFDAVLMDVLRERGVEAQVGRMEGYRLTEYATFINDCIDAGVVTLAQWRGLALFVSDTCKGE